MRQERVDAPQLSIHIDGRADATDSSFFISLMFAELIQAIGVLNVIFTHGVASIYVRCLIFCLLCALCCTQFLCFMLVHRINIILPCLYALFLTMSILYHFLLGGLLNIRWIIDAVSLISNILSCCKRVLYHRPLFRTNAIRSPFIVYECHQILY